MGLASELMCGVSGLPDLVVRFASICRNMESEQEEWIAALRAAGVKAAHPDDGWVDRKNNTVKFVYPQFDDGATVGDLVALGWPRWNSKTSAHRVVRLVEFQPGVFGGGVWKFENAEGHGRRSRTVQPPVGGSESKGE